MKALPPYQGVVCFSGLPGSGKTYRLVDIGVKALRAGKRVFTNAGFEIHDVGGCGRRSEIYYSLEELLTIGAEDVALLDEAPVYVNSRKSSEFPRGLLYKLTQVRKDGNRFYYSAIDEMMVDVNLRRVTFWTKKCRRSWFGFFKTTTVAPIDRRTADDKPVDRHWWRINADVAAAYDTFAKVWIPPEVVEALLTDVAKGWVPLTGPLQSAVWRRDRETAMALLRDYQERGAEAFAAAAADGASGAEDGATGTQFTAFGWCAGCDGELVAVGYNAAREAWLCRACDRDTENGLQLVS